MKISRILNLLSAVTFTVGFAPLSLQAASGTWTGLTDNTWQGANWSVSPAPGSTTFAFNQADVATFNTTGSNVISIDTGRNIRSIAFTTAASTYTIGTNGSNSLLLAHSGSVATALAGQQEIIAAPLVLQPASATTAGTYQFIATGSGVPTTTSATLNFTGPISGGTTTQGIALTLSGNSNNPAGSMISGEVSNGGAATGFSVVKVNSSLWSLTGTNNSFTGGVRVDQGTLNVATISNTGTNSSIGSGGGLTFVAGGSGNATLNINGAGGETNRAITFNNNTGGVNHAIISSNGSGPVVLTGNITPGTVGNTTAATFELAGGNLGANVVSGAIPDANGRTTSLVKSGAGTWTLNGTSNTYTGTTTVTTGTLAGAGANAFGSTSGISITGAGTLSLRGDANTSFVKASDSSSYAVTITANNATISVDRATIAGTGQTMTIGALTINTAVTNQTNFTGANNTSLNVGAVITGNSTSGTETVNNTNVGGGTLTFASLSVNRTGTPTVAFTGNGNTTISGAITEAAVTKLTKSGIGTLTLRGASSYTGTTTVSTGTLAIANTASLAAGSAVTVQNNATLDVAGTVHGAVTVDSGAILKGHGGLFNASVTINGIHSPGASPVLQTFTTGISYGATSTLNAELVGDSLGLRGTDYDGIDVTGGNLTIATAATFKLIGSSVNYSAASWDVNRSFNIIDFSGAGTSTGVFVLDTSNAGSFAGQGSWGILNTNKDIVLNWVAVPEPNVAAMIGSISVIALLRRRRQSP